MISKVKGKVFILFVFLRSFFFADSAAQGQELVIPEHGNTVVHVQSGQNYTLYDPGYTSYYGSNCDGSITIVSDDSSTINISGYFSTEYNCDFINIHEGTSADCPMIGYFSGLSVLNVTSHTGAVTVRFYSDALINWGGFALNVSVCSRAEGQPYNVAVTDITTSSATIAWDDSTAASQWTILYGSAPNSLNHDTTVSTRTVTISGLNQYSYYYYRVSNGTDTVCPSIMRRFKTECSEEQGGCIDFSNLNSCYVTARYGIYAHPDNNDGIVDYGPASSLSRHTVHTDTNERDSRTNNQLRTIPQGYSSSVRLGNWSSGGEAESITYEYMVDTNIGSMLLLKYAAVLEDPSHPVAEQPMFTFKILDENCNPINSSCYSATFVANEDLGWNTIHHHGIFAPADVLWKDWTTVGIDLAPLHGQRILIKLTTYDCARQQHFGYAYFVLDCGEKIVYSSDCGEAIENTFYAPEGFAYRWFNVDAPNTTLSTQRSLHVTQAGEYHCTLQFVGAPTGASCSFDLVALAGERYPAASFTWEQTNDDCSAKIKLHNTSVICSDSAKQQPTPYPCERILWLVDGDSVSTDNSTTLAIEPGQHTIRLVASIGNGNCTDTASQQIHIDYPCMVYDTVSAYLCPNGSYTLFDTTITQSGNYQRDSANLRRTLLLSDAANDTSMEYDTIVENSLPFGWNGMSITHDSLADGWQSDFLLRFDTLNHAGCDSINFLALHVWHNRQTSLFDTVCDNQLPYTWNDTTVYENENENEHVLSAHFLTSHGADSTVSMTLTVHPSYQHLLRDTVCDSQLPYSWNDTTIYENGNEDENVLSAHFVTIDGCDSLVTMTLTVFPTYHHHLHDTVCDNQLPYSWNDTTIYENEDENENVLSSHFATIDGCDSLVDMTLIVNPTNTIHHNDTIVENQLPYAWNGMNISKNEEQNQNNESTLIFDTTITSNRYGCDSTETLTLLVWNNLHIYLYDTVCDNQLPYTWNDTTVYGNEDENVLSAHFLTIHGSDSIVTMTLTIHPTKSTDLRDTVCDNQLPYTWNDTTIDENEDENENVLSSHFSTIYGCDSLVSMTLTVVPTYHHHFHDTVCDNQLPYTWYDTTIYESENQYENTLPAHFATVYGCDSILTMHLTVYQTYHLFDYAKVCDGVPYTWTDGNSYSHSTYEPTITYSDIHGCDSVRHLILSLDNGFQASLSATPTMVSINNPIVRLTDRSESLSREWYFGHCDVGGGTFLYNPSAFNFIDTARITTFTFPTDADSVAVLLVAHNSTGCIDSVWTTVHCDRATVWTPNAFTPDEPQNNRFFVAGNDLASGEVWVYTRQGQFVAHFDALGGSWDGTKNGRACPQGTYTWVLTYTTKANPRQQLQTKGTVTLIR